VKFKLVGGVGLMLLFVLAQAVFLARHVQEEKS
jgi:intracellular septation protein A